MKICRKTVVVGTLAIFASDLMGGEELVTRTYPVKSEWLISYTVELRRETLKEHFGSEGFTDPFAPPENGGEPFIGQVRGGRPILELAGISFGEGSSAIHNPAKSELIVRNTLEQHERIAKFMETLAEKFGRQFLFRFREVSLDETQASADRHSWIFQNVPTPVQAEPFRVGTLSEESAGFLTEGAASEKAADRKLTGHFDFRETLKIFSPTVSLEEVRLPDPVALFGLSDQPMIATVGGTRVRAMADFDPADPSKIRLSLIFPTSADGSNARSFEAFQVTLGRMDTVAIRQEWNETSVSLLFATVEDIDSRTNLHCAPKQRALNAEDLEKFAQASDAANRASLAMAENSNQEAVEWLQKAIESLPSDHLKADVRRGAYEEMRDIAKQREEK